MHQIIINDELFLFYFLENATRFCNPDGTWFKEGHGVDPDIEVNEDPTQLAKGIDPQLEKAIEILNGKLKNIKTLHPQRPKKEDRSR